MNQVMRVQKYILGLILILIGPNTHSMGRFRNIPDIKNDSRNEILIALSNFPGQLNPLYSTDSNSQNINRLIHLSLVDIGSNLNIVCRFCNSWEEKFNYSNLEKSHYRIKFEIKKDAKFWDGTNVTALDVIQSWKYFTSEEDPFKSPFRFAFNKIIDIKIVTETSLELLYENFDPEHLTNLTLLKIVKWDNQKKEFIGCGPYKPKSISENDITLVENFVNEKKLINLPPLHFKFIKDETTLALKLINKEIDLSLAEISIRKQNYLGKFSYLKNWNRVGSNVQYIGINHNNKYLKNLNIRKALNYLTPRKLLLENKLKNSGVMSYSTLSPAFDVAIKGDDDIYDPIRAQKLLDESGAIIKNHKDGRYRFILNWRVNSNRAAIEMAQSIGFYWEKAHIKVNYIIQEWGTYYRGFKNGDYDVVSASWVGVSGPEMLRSAFHSDQIPPNGNNRGFYKNPDLDQILDQALKETSKESAARYYIKAQKMIFDDLPYIFLWHPNIVWISNHCYEIPQLYSNGSFLSLLNIKLIQGCKS